MKKLTYIILHLLILPLLLYGFSFSVSAEETSSEDTVIQVTAEDGSDIHDDTIQWQLYIS